MYLDCIFQNPPKIEFSRLGFDFIPLAYFEVCYKKTALWALFLTLQGSYLETILTLQYIVYIVSVSSEFLSYCYEPGNSSC